MMRSLAWIVKSLRITAKNTIQYIWTSDSLCGLSSPSTYTSPTIYSIMTVTPAVSVASFLTQLCFCPEHNNTHWSDSCLTTSPINTAKHYQSRCERMHVGIGSTQGSSCRQIRRMIAVAVRTKATKRSASHFHS